MRLHMILPHIEPTHVTRPSACPYDGCQGAQFRFHQKVTKPLKDTVYQAVIAHRYHCLTCGRTFRVYPRGVGKAHVSQRVKGLAVLLYLLGLSYGAVSLTLDAFGIYVSKSRVYDAVQEAVERARGLNRRAVFEQIRAPAEMGDATRVKYRGRWLSLGLMVDNVHGLVLTAQDLSGEDVGRLKTWIEPLATAVGAEIVVTDDADWFRPVAEHLGLSHQVRKAS